MDEPKSIEIQPIRDEDRIWIKDWLMDRWGDIQIVVHGTVYEADSLPGFVARVRNEVVGLITFYFQDHQCEVVSLDSLKVQRGIGTALLQAVGLEAISAGCRRLWLVTTNDNLDALRFFQRRGFVLCGLQPGAVDKARLIKPSIPLVGQNAIPIRDEIDLEIDPLRLVE